MNKATKAKYPSYEIVLNTIQKEYEHEFERNNRLDNKISITTAFCSLMLLPLIDQVRVAEIFIIQIINLLSVMLFAYTIISLIFLLKPTDFKRFSLSSHASDNSELSPFAEYISQEKEYASHALITAYIEINVENKAALSKRYKSYNSICNVIIIGVSLVGFSVLLNFIV